MKKHFGLTLGLITLLANVPVPTNKITVPELSKLPPAKPAGVTGPVLEKGIALATYLNPETKIHTMVLNVVEKTLPRIMRDDPQFSSLENAYPGLINVIIQSMKPKMLAAYSQKLPLLWNRLGAVYANGLTSAELDTVDAFYKSPVGKKVVAGFIEQNDSYTAAKQMVQNGSSNSAALESAVSQDTAITARKVGLTLTDAERVAIFKFENSPLGVKISKMLPDITRTMLEWDSYFTQEQINDFNSTRSAAITAFIEETDAKNGKTATEVKPNT
jgi:hypothetical protein